MIGNQIKLISNSNVPMTEIYKTIVLSLIQLKENILSEMENLIISAFLLSFFIGILIQETCQRKGS